MIFVALALLGLVASGDAAAPMSAAAAEQPGKNVYLRQCAGCHGETLTGGRFGPPLKSAVFAAHWQSLGQEELLKLISQRMPPANPGGLAQGDLSAAHRFHCGGK